MIHSRILAIMICFGKAAGRSGANARRALPAWMLANTVLKAG